MLYRLIVWFFSLSGSRTNKFGSSRFLTGLKKWLLLNRFQKGFVINGKSRISLNKSYSHICVIAPTGTGKTSRVVLPNVLNLEDTSAIITDPSGEIYELSKGYLRSKGYAVKLLNLNDAPGSLKYNPLFRCNTHTEIQKLATILVDTAYQESKGEAFWDESAKGIIGILLRAVKQFPGHRQNLGELYRLLNMFGHKQEEINRIMAEKLDDRSFEEFKAFLSQDDKVMNSILSTAKTALNKFSDPNLDELTCEETLLFESIRERKTAIFIVVPEHEVQYYSFILTILYTQIFSFCMDPPRPGRSYLPVLFLLDEFGNSGKLPGFSTMITTLRKRKAGVLVVLQDYEQLVNIYGKANASTIYNGGFTSKIFMPGMSHQLCEEVSRMLGKRTLSFREAGYRDERSGFIPSRESELGRELLTPDEIRTLRINRAIFIHGNQFPVMLKTLPWYKNRKLKRRTKIR